jgi:hypothetical protein
LVRISSAFFCSAKSLAQAAGVAEKNGFLDDHVRHRSAPRRHALRQCGAATLRQPPLAATDRLATIDPFAELAEAPRNAKGAQP